MTNLFKGNKYIALPFVVFEVVSLFLSIMQIYIQFCGKFRTALGRYICWFFTIAAVYNILHLAYRIRQRDGEYREKLRIFTKILQTKRIEKTYNPRMSINLSNQFSTPRDSIRSISHRSLNLNDSDYEEASRAERL